MPQNTLYGKDVSINILCYREKNCFESVWDFH
jgi:hypothetical protein